MKKKAMKKKTKKKATKKKAKVAKKKRKKYTYHVLKDMSQGVEVKKYSGENANAAIQNLFDPGLECVLITYSKEEAYDTAINILKCTLLGSLKSLIELDSDNKNTINSDEFFKCVRKLSHILDM